MRNIFTRFFRPKLPEPAVATLTTMVKTLNSESKCSSAMSYILRALDYEPQNRSVLELAQLIVWGCIGIHHSCGEPLAEVQMNDSRLDSLFSECAECLNQWIPGTSVFESLFGPKMLMISTTGAGGHCGNCKKAFCAGHVKDPLPTIEFGGNPHCPLCGSELDCYHVFGRKARQPPRSGKKLAYVVVVRDGFIAPDKEYCLKVFRHSSNDVLEDLPSVVAMDLQPWEYRAERVLDKVREWLKTQRMYTVAADRVNIWSGLDTESNTRFHLVKIWNTLPKVTLQNLFTIPQCSENFPFETATLTEKSQTAYRHTAAPRTCSPPGVTNQSSASAEQEFVGLYEQYLIEGLGGFPDPRQVVPSQLETLNKTAVNKAGDVLIRKYNLSEQEAAKIAERAIKLMVDATTGTVEENETPAATSRGTEGSRTAALGTPQIALNEALVAVSVKGWEVYQKDRDEALRWFDGKGFPNPGHKESSDVRWLMDMSRRADDSSLWDEAWGGFHYALVGALALNMADQVPDICWYLGRAQTGRTQYNLATLYLETAYNLAQRLKNKDLGFRALLAAAVVGKLINKPDVVQQAYLRAKIFLFPPDGDLSFSARAAMALFQEGKKNQEWRNGGKPVRYCLVHASGLYQVSLDINRRLNDKRAISITLMNLGVVWKNLGQEDRALRCWRETIPLLIELQDQHNLDLVNLWMSEQ